MRYSYLLCSLFLLLISYQHLGNQPKQDPEYIRLYHFAEKLYNNPTDSKQNDSLALSTYLRVIDLLKKEHQNDSVLRDCNFKAGIYEQTFGRYASAIPYFLECFRLTPSLTHQPQSAIYLPALYTGNSYYYLNQFDSAKYYYKVSEDIATKTPGIKGIERLYNTQGVLNYETGNYRQSVNYFEKAIAILKQNSKQDPGLLVNFMSNLASAWKRLEDYDTALAIYKSLLRYHQNNNELLHNIASVYLAIGASRDAIATLKKVHYEDANRYDRIKQDNDLGLAYLSIKSFDSAKYFLDRATSLNGEENGERKNSSYGSTLRYQAMLLREQGKYTYALVSYQASIMQLVSSFNLKNIYKNPSNFKGLFSFTELYEALLGKAGAFADRYTQSNDTNDLKASVQTFLSLYDLTDHIEKTYATDEARSFLNKRKYLSHRLPIDICIKLFQITRNTTYLQQGLFFDEQNKASTLATNLQQEQVMKAVGVPDSLLEKESNTKGLIARLALKASLEKDSLSIQHLQNQQREAELELGRLQEKIGEDIGLNQTKFIYNQFTIDNLQRNILPSNSAILSYHIGDSSILCFVITKNSFNYFMTPITDSFQLGLQKIYSRVQQVEESNTETISGYAAYFYKLLIKPAEREINGKTNLMIIPDDELNYLPFELLENEDREVILRKYSIVYNYTCSFLKASKQEKSYSLLAMAPFSENMPGGSRDLPPLTASKEEVKGLHGIVLTGTDATKDRFLVEASKYKIIHLATHAKVNDEDPIQSFIAFYPGHKDSTAEDRLYLPEIYNLNLYDSRLVILSACETGSGQLVKGEGIISLSRAFYYAGCPNIITSSWKADDNATSYIVRRFHKYIENGDEAYKALQKAKLDYIDDSKVEKRFKTPSYWAHLKLTGSFEELGAKLSKPVKWNQLLFGLLGLILILLLVTKKFRPRQGDRNPAS